MINALNPYIFTDLLFVSAFKFLRKLVFYDDWSQISIHVALDNIVITDEIRKCVRFVLSSYFIVPQFLCSSRPLR